VSSEFSYIDRVSLRATQWRKLHSILLHLASNESFYARKLHSCNVEVSTIRSIDDLVCQMPFTAKSDLLADRVAHPPFGTNLPLPFENYTRFCQTSGTSSGQPMAWLDTRESWAAMLGCWRHVFDGAELVKGCDRIFFAFSFGPFLGFWTAFEAAASDYLAMPGGGLSSLARLEMMARYEVTVLCCTPTYALHLGEMIGSSSGVGLDKLKVRKIIVAGEPGGSIPEVRERIQQLWEARVYDHHGMTEVGPVSYEMSQHPLCCLWWRSRISLKSLILKLEPRFPRGSVENLF
jgi:phenylacetate-CoA ligase